MSPMLGTGIKKIAGALERPEFERGNYLYAQDLKAAQLYRLGRLDRHRRFLHGSGIICGLWIAPAYNRKRPWEVFICPGVGIGCCGEEIVVSKRSRLDIRDFLWQAPLMSAPRAMVAYVALCYDECLTRPVASGSAGCGCDDTNYQASRICDGFRAHVVFEPPRPDRREPVDLCSPQIIPCPECNEETCLILACIDLPRSENDPITPQRIDNCCRSSSRL